EVNPPSQNPARPAVDFPPEELNQPTLMDLPSGHGPITMYRGGMLDLTQPELAQVRRALVGDTPGAKTLGYDDPRVGQMLLDHFTGPNSSWDGGLGPHWTVDRAQATLFAGTPQGNPHRLPVVLSTPWKGAGEDPYRSHTDGDYPKEKEVSLLSG